jgi:hypothetical protein
VAISQRLFSIVALPCVLFALGCLVMADLAGWFGPDPREGDR